MWIADSDIPLPKEINDFIIKRANYPYYGYNVIDDKFKKSFLEFNHNFRKQEFDFSEVFFTPGTVFSYSTALQALTKKGDSVLFNIPIYSPLVSTSDAWERNNIYLHYKIVDEKFYFDFDEIEKTIIQNKVKVYTLVSPLNPSGRVWEYDELLKLVEICKKYDVAIISDEIHCDIIMPGKKFYSMLEFTNIYDKIVVVTSVNKTFNIPGLQSGWGICKNKELFNKIKSILNLNHIPESPNIFAQSAMIGCFEQGESFHSELIQLFSKNIAYVKSYFATKCPNLKVMQLDATFLPYVCFRKTNISSIEMKTLLWSKAKVLVQFSDDFVDETSCNFRLNIATPFEIVEEAVLRIANVINKYTKKETNEE